MPALTGMRDQDGNFIEFSTLMRLYDKIYDTYTPSSLEAEGILVRAEPFNQSEKPYRDFDAALGWGGLFEKDLEIIQAKGDHISMIEVDENLAGIARDVNALLERDRVRQPDRTEADQQELLLAS
jgi:thioesterase domain-containing protein